MSEWLRALLSCSVSWWIKVFSSKHGCWLSHNLLALQRERYPHLFFIDFSILVFSIFIFSIDYLGFSSGICWGVKFLWSISGTVCICGDISYGFPWGENTPFRDLSSPLCRVALSFSSPSSTEVWSTFVFSLWREMSVFFLSGYNCFLHPVSHNKFQEKRKHSSLLFQCVLCVWCSPQCFLSFFYALDCLGIPFLIWELSSSFLDTHWCLQVKFPFTCLFIWIKIYTYSALIYTTHHGAPDSAPRAGGHLYTKHRASNSQSIALPVPPTCCHPRVSLKVKLLKSKTKTLSGE